MSATAKGLKLIPLKRQLEIIPSLFGLRFLIIPYLRFLSLLSAYLTGRHFFFYIFIRTPWNVGDDVFFVLRKVKDYGR